MILLSDLICVNGIIIGYATTRLLKEEIARKDLAIGFYAGWILFVLFYLILVVSDALEVDTSIDIAALRALKIFVYACALICMIVTFFIVREPRK